MRAAANEKHQQAIERERRDHAAVVQQRDARLTKAASQQKHLELSLNNQLGQMNEEMQCLKSETVKDLVDTSWHHRMEKKRLSDGINEQNRIIAEMKGEQRR